MEILSPKILEKGLYKAWFEVIFKKKKKLVPAGVFKSQYMHNISCNKRSYVWQFF
jgi:hypothetical protein